MFGSPARARIGSRFRTSVSSVSRYSYLMETEAEFIAREAFIMAEQLVTLAALDEGTAQCNYDLNIVGELLKMCESAWPSDGGTTFRGRGPEGSWRVFMRGEGQ